MLLRVAGWTLLSGRAPADGFALDQLHESDDLGSMLLSAYNHLLKSASEGEGEDEDEGEGEGEGGGGGGGDEESRSQDEL